MPELPTDPDVSPSGSGSPAGSGAEVDADGPCADDGVEGTVIPDEAADDGPDDDDEFGTLDTGDADPDTVDEQLTTSAVTSNSATAHAGTRRRSGKRGTFEPYKAPPSVHGQRAGLGSNPGIVPSHLP
jgi:hypothetical protein